MKQSRFDHLSQLPQGDFRFIAVDVETAGYQIESICQIGLAFVGYDNSIFTYSSYVDPQTAFAESNVQLHGIDGATVKGAPVFSQLLPELRPLLQAHPLVQHSRFDERAFDGACKHAGLPILTTMWIDSVKIAREAWPAYKGNGGHGLAHLKQKLGLSFHHHDAGEDARAAALVVLAAESERSRQFEMLPAYRQLAFAFSS